MSWPAQLNLNSLVGPVQRQLDTRIQIRPQDTPLRIPRDTLQIGSERQSAPPNETLVGNNSASLGGVWGLLSQIFPWRWWH